MTWRASVAAPLQRCRRSRHLYSLGNLDTTREAQFERGDDAIATRTARHDQANTAVRRPRFVRTDAPTSWLLPIDAFRCCAPASTRRSYPAYTPRRGAAFR